MVAAPAHAQRPRHGRRGLTPTPRLLVVGIALASALLAAWSDASPTGSTAGDVIWSGAFGASLSLALADARRWTWFPLASLGLAVASGWFAVVCGLGAVGLTMFFGLNEARRRRWMGALVGLLAAQAIVRGRTYGFTGLPTLVAAAACLPAYWSAVANTSTRARRIVRASAIVGVVVIALLTIFTIVSAARARGRVLRAIDFGNEAVEASERGDQDLATVLIGAAGDELRSIADDFNQPWLAPGRLIPILGQHSAALRTMADAGADVADEGADVLAALDTQTLLPGEGTVAIDEVERLVPRIDSLFDTLDRSAGRVDSLDLTWIARPASSRIETLRDELDRLDGPVGDAREVVGVLPNMLGASGERRYLVMFMTAAELRAAGGFAGNWAEIAVANGRIEVVDAGRGNDLNEALPGGRAVLPSPEEVEAYEGFRTDELFQNLPVVADFPWVAEAGAAFYEQATGRAIDTVIGVDSRAMAALVALTGPVDVAGRSFNASELEEFILTGQYVDYEGNDEERLRVLDELTRTVFAALTDGQLPSPFSLADTAGPLVAGDHLQIVSFEPSEASALATVEADGAFPQPDGHDLLAVRSQNSGENKIDTYLRRDVRYSALFDAETGLTQASIQVTLTNTAPATGLPGAIIGNNDQDLPFGTNATRLQIYSPLGFQGATLDGESTSVTWNRELGWAQYELDLEIPPGAVTTVKVDLAGVLDVSEGYRLRIDNQPLVQPDRVTLDIRQVNVGQITEIASWDADPGTSVELQSDQWVVVPTSE